MLCRELLKASDPIILYLATHLFSDEEECFLTLYVIPYFSQTWAAEYFPDRKSSHARILSSIENFGLDIKTPLK